MLNIFFKIDEEIIEVAKMKKHVSLVKKFIDSRNYMNLAVDDKNDSFCISQNLDSKNICFYLSDIEDVLDRVDPEGEAFLQINFKSGKKILLTEKYVGFAPAPCRDLDSSKLPRVVTTVDLFSVIEVIESYCCGGESYKEDFDDVKLFFESICCGAESAGFNLTGERLWIEKLLSNSNVAVSQF